MAKIVTSQGLQEFVQTGKPTEVRADKPEQVASKAPPLEVVGSASTADVKPGEKKDEKAPETVTKEAPKAEETGLEPEDHDLAERAKKRIGKKHYEMKKAQEEAEEAKAQSASDAQLAENLFNERELWRKRAEEAEKKAQELVLKVTPPAKTEPDIKEPSKDDPKYIDEKGQFKLDDYVDDRYAYKTELSRREQAQKQAEQEAQKVAEAFRARIVKATEKNKDWEDVVKASPITLQNECLQYIAQSEYGTDLAYFLAKNQEVAEKIRAMHPIRAIAELGKIETSFEKPAAKVAEKTEATPPLATSQTTVEQKGAPAPITPISTNGTGSINVDPAKMSFRELRAYERERNRRK